MQATILTETDYNYYVNNGEIPDTACDNVRVRLKSFDNLQTFKKYLQDRYIILYDSLNAWSDGNDYPTKYVRVQYVYVRWNDGNTTVAVLEHRQAHNINLIRVGWGIDPVARELGWALALSGHTCKLLINNSMPSAARSIVQ